MGASLQTILPGFAGPDVSKQAAALPYASLSVDINRNQGLLVLGTQAGETTYWQSRDDVTLALTNGGLASTGGLQTDILSSRYLPASNAGDVEFSPWLEPGPTRYRLERSWQNAQGLIQYQQAEGRMICASPVEVALPLQTRMLEPCQLVQHWANGMTTTDTVWRDPSDYRVWAASMVPWPGQRALEWHVAKPWWTPTETSAAGGT